MNKMTGHQKFQQAGEKLKTEMAKKEVEEEKAKEEVNNQLAVLRSNSELARMYSESSQVGAANIAGELPLLKVHSVGRSTKNELSNGQEPNDGYFFYKPTGEQFESIECHILTISKGFRAEGMEGKEIFNQIMGGAIIEGDDYKPFIMYFTGLKLSYLWEFGKQVSKYTKAKPVPIPMFALKVRLTTKKVANNYGKSWVVNFEIVKTEDGAPELVLDPGRFQFLKDSVETVEDTIASLIATKTAKEEDDIPHPAQDAQDEILSPDEVLS